MSLKKCKECGGDVSTKATACPRCGAKQAEGVGCVTAIIVVLVVGALANALANIITGDRSPRPTPADQSTKSPAPPKAPPPPPQWGHTSGTDNVSGKTISVAYLKSANKHDFAFPYGPGISAELKLRNHPLRERRDR